MSAVAHGWERRRFASSRTGVSHARNWRSPLVEEEKGREEITDIFLNLGSYSAPAKNGVAKQTRNVPKGC